MRMACQVSGAPVNPGWRQLLDGGVGGGAALMAASSRAAARAPSLPQRPARKARWCTVAAGGVACTTRTACHAWLQDHQAAAVELHDPSGESVRQWCACLGRANAAPF
jgi:hypothetical protein